MSYPRFSWPARRSTLGPSVRPIGGSPMEALRGLRFSMPPPRRLREMAKFDSRRSGGDSMPPPRRMREMAKFDSRRGGGLFRVPPPPIADRQFRASMPLAGTEPRLPS